MEVDAAHGLALIQHLLAFFEHAHHALRFLVAARPREFAVLENCLLYCCEVRQRELGVDHFDIVNRRDLAGNVHHVVVLEAAHHMGRGVAGADVGEELVAKAFALRCALHQTRNVHKLHRRRHHLLRLHDVGQLIEPLVGHFHNAAIRLDGAERIVLRRDTRLGQRVKEGGFADVRKTDDAALDSHDGPVVVFG